MVGSVPVGGDAPVTVQTMTNTPTSDAAATIAQIRRCEEAGVDIIRVSCPDQDSTAALREIVRNVNVPIVADIHFHYKRALEAADAGAACLRINPGNIGSSERVAEVVRAAKVHGCAIRLGVNAGSLGSTWTSVSNVTTSPPTPIDSSRLRMACWSMKPIEPSVCATQTSSDCGGIFVDASSACTRMFPTCGPFPCTTINR